MDYFFTFCANRGVGAEGSGDEIDGSLKGIIKAPCGQVVDTVKVGNDLAAKNRS
jgi:hypothetical protein